MKYPQAIREDNNSFPYAGFLPGYGRLLLFLRWTSYACPHCHKVFRRDFWPGNVRLGSGERTCAKCGNVFDDGSREWMDLGIRGKIRIFCPPLLCGIWGGFAVAGGVSYFAFPRDEHSLFVGVFAFLVGIVPVLLCSPYHVIAVLRSNRRYETNQRSTCRMSEIGGNS
jgi:hypothetical protein